MTRSASEIRDYLVVRLGWGLRRPGMYGGESALLLYLDTVAFADGLEGRLQEELEALKAKKAFVSTGVTGGVENVLGQKDDDVMASVYAEIAHRCGWLVLDRILTADEYERVRHTAATDQNHSDVLAEFGPPSILIGGSNPYYPKTLAYGCAQRDEPLVFFHFWNGTWPGEEQTWPPQLPEPALLAIRCAGDTFAEGFTFTPMGEAYRAVGRRSPGGT